MNFKGSARKLEDGDIHRVAQRIDCDEAAIRAVAEVESRGGGFLNDGRPKILFEAHIFSRRTDHAFDHRHPNISSRKWNKSLYGPGGANQYRRLERALDLNANAALASASWGMFQIMGFNYEACGFNTIKTFVEAMKESEGRHLDAMAAFLENRRLDTALRRHDWSDFARGYNGPAFRENKYDEKLDRAWRKHSSDAPWLSMLQIQAALNRAGTKPQLVEDGMVGPKTRRAIRAFQKDARLAVTGDVGPELMARLSVI
jgi:hypothetical protein